MKKTTEDSVPIVAVIALLTAGGWLVIPLRYLWDERSKNNEYHREDVKLRAEHKREEMQLELEHRRQICSGMLDRIHRYLDLFYGKQLILTEMIHLASARAQSAAETGSDEDRHESSGVLLYRMAEYFVHQDWMHRSGALLFLRTAVAEGEVEAANRALGSALMIGFRGVTVRRHLLERGVLADGVTSLEEAKAGDVQTRSPRCVDMVEFNRRLEATNDNNWDDLRVVCRILKDHLREAAVLADIRAKAKMAVERYFLHLNATYKEWYEGEVSSDETRVPAASAT